MFGNGLFAAFAALSKLMTGGFFNADGNSADSCQVAGMDDAALTLAEHDNQHSGS